MVEPHRQQPLSGHVLETNVATAGPKVSVQVGDRLGDASVVGVQHRPTACIAQAVQDRDELGRPQHHIKGGHGVATMPAAEELPVSGWRLSNMRWNPAGRAVEGCR